MKWSSSSRQYTAGNGRQIWILTIARDPPPPFFHYGRLGTDGRQRGLSDTINEKKRWKNKYFKNVFGIKSKDTKRKSRWRIVAAKASNDLRKYTQKKYSTLLSFRPIFQPVELVRNFRRDRLFLLQSPTCPHTSISTQWQFNRVTPI